MRTPRSVLLSVAAVGGLALTFGCGSDETQPNTGNTADSGVVFADAEPADTGEPPDSGEVVVDCASRPVEAPSLRSEASLIYDDSKERLLMFGGNIAEVICPTFSREPSADMWAFELDCNNWRPVASTGGPSARVRHAVTIDTTRNRMILFGGRTGPVGNYTFLNDVWAFDLATDTWSQIQTTGPMPTPRDDTVLEYDPGQDRVIMFAGDIDERGTLGGPQDDLWSLSMATGEWSRLTPGGARPGRRLLHGSANLGDRMVVFGGAINFVDYLSDMWVFDFTLNTWTEVYATRANPGPRVRFGPAVFVDSPRTRAIVFAGHDPGVGTPGDPGALGNRNDTWSAALGGDGWTEIRGGDTLNPNARPAGQCDFPADFTNVDLEAPDRRSAFPYAQSASHAYIFGGNTDCGRANDIWSFEFETNTWTELWAANGGISCPHTGQVNCANLCF